MAAQCAAAAVVSVREIAADSAAVLDRETGFTFSQHFAKYATDASRGIMFGVALPSNLTSFQPFDAVIQITAPVEVGWTGLAWGGRMTANPLTVAWANGNNVVISSRYTTQHTLPGSYTGASYVVMKTGTHVNRTHWQITAKCAGCTNFASSGGYTTYLSPRGNNNLAFAYAQARPSNPSSNTSSFPYHDVHGYWQHDFTSASNPTFETLVAKNL